MISNSKVLDKATAFKDYLYTTEGQDALGRSRIPSRGSRRRCQVHRQVPRADQAVDHCRPSAGWKAVDSALFTKDTGSIAVIYDNATK